MLLEEGAKVCNRAEAASNIRCLLLKIILQSTQTLQLFTINTKQKIFIKVIKNAKQQGLC
jgi:hypothetical protein